MSLGDADWICNWFGNLAAANAITYSSSAAFNAAAVKNYTVNGVSGGTYKTAGNLSWLRVFGAGHEVPYYRELTRYYLCTMLTGVEPALALQAFKQTMSKKPISST
jgi:carboxypeptidase C (cathepsin A)